MRPPILPDTPQTVVLIISDKLIHHRDTESTENYKENKKQFKVESRE